MPQLKNKEILECILRITIEVIGRRTSDAYANVVISNSVKKLAEKHSFLQHVEIKGTQYIEMFDAIKVESDVDNVEVKEVGLAIKEFMEDITRAMGKNAGYYFIREIKEGLSYDYEKTIKEIGVDLDFLQLEYITNMKESLKYNISNSDTLKYVFVTLFEVLDKEIGGDSAYKSLSQIVSRFSIEYDLFRYIKINDIRAVQGVDAVNVNTDVNKVEPAEVGAAIQKCIQELNNNMAGRGFNSFMEKLRSHLNIDHIFKLENIGVNLDVIQYGQVLVVKNVLKAIIDVISEYSSETYAFTTVSNSIEKFKENFVFLNFLKMDVTHYSEGLNAIDVSSEIESVRTSELGRSIQKIIEYITMHLGEGAGAQFIEKFKNRLGKAYILRIEEMGVNLHMIELRRSVSL